MIEDVVPDEDARAEITFAVSGVTAKCHETDTVLAVAKANGLNIPSGCTFGLCGPARSARPRARCIWSITAASRTRISRKAISWPVVRTRSVRSRSRYDPLKTKKIIKF